MHEWKVPITVNPHCIAQYLSWFLPVQWNIYIFKCQWSLTALSHRELQGINNDSGIAKISSYKSFHFFPSLILDDLSISLPLSSSLFQEPVFPKAVQQLCGLLEPATVGKAGLQSALNPYLVSVTANLHLLRCHLFCHLLRGWSNPSAAGQCFSKCKSATKSPRCGAG